MADSGHQAEAYAGRIECNGPTPCRNFQGLLAGGDGGERAQIDEIYNWDWQLYVLHWDQARGLLFIHNSSNASFFQELAKAVAGDVERVSGPNIFRGLSGINHLKLRNARTSDCWNNSDG